MPRPSADDRLDRILDRVLRGFARLGAVAVAATGFALRTERGRRAVDGLYGRIGQAAGWAGRRSGTFDPLATRAERLLDRLLDRWRS